MTAQFTSTDFLRYLKSLHDQATDLRKQLSCVDKKIQNVAQIMSNVSEWNRDNPPIIGSDRHGHIKPDQVAHCTSQNAALQEIARLSGGLANPSSAADIIIAAGKTNGTKRGLVSTLSGFTSDEETWEWVEPGVYRLKDYSPPEDSVEEPIKLENRSREWVPDVRELFGISDLP